MKVVFIGSSNFGLKCLKECLKIPNVTVTGAITAPKIFKISYSQQGVNNILHSDISSFAMENKIPIRSIKDSMKDPTLLEVVKTWEPDIFLVAGWYHMIPKSWRKLAPAYGLHASLLPDYSGGAPLVWAIINGETKTGITLFQMDDGVDSGPIAGQIEEKILDNDTISSLYERIEQKGLELISKTLPKLTTGSLKLRQQDDNKRRVMPQRCPEDGSIDWNQDAKTILRFIRAQTKPYPGAFTTLAGEKLYIWNAKVYTSEESSQAGENKTFGDIKQLSDGRFIVYCKTGSIQLSEFDFESKKFKGIQLSQLLNKGNHRLGSI